MGRKRIYGGTTPEERKATTYYGDWMDRRITLYKTKITTRYEKSN